MNRVRIRPLGGVPGCLAMFAISIVLSIVLTILLNVVLAR